HMNGKNVTDYFDSKDSKYFVKLTDDGEAQLALVVPVTSVTLNKTASVEVDKTVRLTAMIEPSNAANKAVTWTTSSADIATVTDGVVTGVKAGSADITVTSVESTDITATCTVTVTPKPAPAPAPAPNPGGGDSGGGSVTPAPNPKPEPEPTPEPEQTPEPEPEPEQEPETPESITIEGDTVLSAAVDAPDAELTKTVEENAASLLPGLPANTPFFSNLENVTFPSINELMSYIEEIYETATGEHIEFKAVILPARVSVPGAYLMKLALTDEQREELRGSRNLAYHAAPVDDESNAQTAEEGEDVANGVLLNANGEKVNGEYDGGDLNVLAYFARADVTYIQYITAEAEAEPEAETEQRKSGGHSGGGCDTGPGLGDVALLLGAAAFALRRR
ncbi:MAG: Ig domain-containing protein, partial [Synergistaceae bacterium]|nr:Ig domain-containing protein [Synergistaceae bacterium]